MQKSKFERTNPRSNIGTIGHYGCPSMAGAEALVVAALLLSKSKRTTSKSPPTPRQIADAERMRWNADIDRAKAGKRAAAQKGSHD